MKSVFDQLTREELMSRIDSLDENSRGHWGKMNVYQMTKHCVLWDEWVLGRHNPTYKQEFLGKFFGKKALKDMMKDDRPIKKNMPSGRYFIVKGRDGLVAPQKKIWMNLIAEYEYFSNAAFIHDFFGKMTREEIGIFAYKHTDHHLRQFGV